MLKDLDILNGQMSLEFDPMNTIYTVNVEENVKMLEFEYEIAQEDQISIIGNTISFGKNELIITVYNETEAMSYYLYVYKEKSEEANLALDSYVSLELEQKQEISEYALPVISSACFIVILLFFTLLFKKNKKNKF